jgi:hypothetical protein
VRLQVFWLKSSQLVIFTTTSKYLVVQITVGLYFCSLQGATVVTHGSVWDEADARARQDAVNPEVAYIPPFDHPDIWLAVMSLNSTSSVNLLQAIGRQTILYQFYVTNAFRVQFSDLDFERVTCLGL